MSKCDRCGGSGIERKLIGVRLCQLCKGYGRLPIPEDTP